MFVRPGDQVYEGQCVGIYSKSGDLKINVAKAKALTNMRASQSEKKVGGRVVISLFTAGPLVGGSGFSQLSYILYLCCIGQKSGGIQAAGRVLRGLSSGGCSLRQFVLRRCPK
jgi:hypothetical protein